jgi:hypothetical protein
MNQATENLPHIRRHAETQGSAILERLSERRLPTAQWLVGSHGAAIRVSGEHDAHFERLVVLIPCPQDASPARFQSWAEERIRHLDWYMEASNTGKVVNQVAGERQAAAVIMRRLGRTPGDPEAGSPDPSEAFPVLIHFAANVERYVLNIGDEDLRYVRALKLYRIPRRSRSDEYTLGLDVLPTLIGVDGDSMPINPLTLLRGIIGEFAEIYDERRRKQGPLPAIYAVRERRSAARDARELNELVDNLDRLCARIDLERPGLAAVRAWLSEMAPAAQKKKRRTSLKTTIAVILACAALAWHLAR